MSDKCITLRHLVFTGPSRENAELEFQRGLNVIYGASETGKSFVLEALDFMLGGSGELRDIPERVGYDQVFLGLELSGEEFTLVRSTSGGDFTIYPGLHRTEPADIEGESLRARHANDRENTVSALLLKTIGLWNSRIKRNAAGDTNSLSFRNLAHLCMINESQIQKQGSPLLTGQFVSKTAEVSVFKLLLTGVDDSGLKSTARDQQETLTKSAKEEVINELIVDYRSRLDDAIGDDTEEDILDQYTKLNQSISRHKSRMEGSETSYRELSREQGSLRGKYNSLSDRKEEIEEMLARFDLLDQHYQSDLARLESTQEAGRLVVSLDGGACPLCGASPEHQHLDEDCDGNVAELVAAAKIESEKIYKLRADLAATVERLNDDLVQCEQAMPKLQGDLNFVQTKISELNPVVSDLRELYSDYLEKKSSVEKTLHWFASIRELEKRRSELNGQDDAANAPNNAGVDLSASTLDNFAREVEDMLKRWEFPDCDRVYFDRESYDLVLAGKPRGSRGKGMRSITHAAFSLALMKHLEKNKDLSHPGYVVLDTPLLAYREPENDEDDLRGTSVKDKFFQDLAGWTTRQIIILENNDPPASVSDDPDTTFFSKSSNGRYGFFPRQITA